MSIAQDFATDYYEATKRNTNLYDVQRPVVYKSGTCWFIACYAKCFDASRKFHSKRITTERADALIAGGMKIVENEYVKSCIRRPGGYAN
ncbi:MAG: hypothetical protein WCG26_00950 [Chloroflexales bacterium]